jgi:hypothetical protein
VGFSLGESTLRGAHELGFGDDIEAIRDDLERSGGRSRRHPRVERGGV